MVDRHSSSARDVRVSLLTILLLTVLSTNMLMISMKTQLLPLQTFQQLMRRECEAQEKADLLRVLLIEDAQATYKELKNYGLLVESMELTTTFVVNGIRNELTALRDTMVFGRWNPRLDFEQLDLSKAATKL
ncbi:hypothetical protein V8E54_004351 [Elaphomyces granulatus]